MAHPLGAGLPSGPGRGRLFAPDGNVIFIGNDRTHATIASDVMQILAKQGVAGDDIYLITIIMAVGWAKLRGVPKDQLIRKIAEDWPHVGAEDGSTREV